MTLVCILGNILLLLNSIMKTHKNLYPQLCSLGNLELAFRKARKRKTLKECVIIFESNLRENLLQLKSELETFTYKPKPIKTFIIKDPKTRKIGASDFRDRVVHHALCNVIAPIFEREFIYDSFANRKGKGVHAAIKRFEKFLGQVYYRQRRGGGNQKSGCTEIGAYALKADIRHYFDTVDHAVLLSAIRRRIRDAGVIWLIEVILKNHKTHIPEKGMPLGNLTSQSFANVYLHELDLFVKHGLKAKYYLRYVDDFVILHRDKSILQKWENGINRFLNERLKIELHPEKSRIIPLKNGITLLGFRVFPRYRLLKKSNALRIWKRLERFGHKYRNGEMSREEIERSFDGWFAYAEFANTYKFRKRVRDRLNEIIGR